MRYPSSVKTSNRGAMSTTTKAFFVWLLCCCASWGMGSIGFFVNAWSFMLNSLSHRSMTTKPLMLPSSTTWSSTSSSLLASRKDNDDVSTETSCAVRRMGLTGVSVSEDGFTVLWGLSSSVKQEKHYWPWRVTSPQAGDKKAATSAQALTLCQLIAGIDLAGSRLPADILAQVTVLSCEQEQNSQSSSSSSKVASKDAVTAERMVGDVQQQLQSIQRQWFPKEAASASEPLTYTDAPAWIRARVRLPLCTLDQIDVEPVDNGIQVTYHVQVRNYGSLVLTHVTDQVLTDVLGPLYDDYTFSDETRRAFLTAALALRYKAPVLVQHSQDDERFVQDVTEAFPLYTTVQKVQTKSDRVATNIVKGWEVHQLQAAYNIALKKNDMKAVAKIRAKLDEMDAMPELPVQDDSELDCME